jgi:sugar fermentation stimulation protein A
MKFSGELIKATFVKRDNRFRASVSVDGNDYKAHVPNSGRMQELLIPGAEVVLRQATAPQRKTPFDFLQVKYQGQWVGIDSRTPPLLLVEAMEQELISELRGWQVERTEPAFGSGRADLLLRRGKEEMFVETKSVNLVIDGIACFPDAPTTRGTRHVLELAEHVQAGGRAAVVFVVQRNDASAVRPYHEADPEFSEACQQAEKAGLPFFALCCKTSEGVLIPIRELNVQIAEK